jgi:hypothetical protein
MTIAVSILTNIAAVFAADSKLTTRGLVGLDEAGEPEFVNQTYDNATKVVQDTEGTSIAMMAGSASLGPIGVLDHIATSAVPRHADPEQQEALIAEFADGMAKLRAAYWHERKVSTDRWPYTVVMLATAPLNSRSPIVRRIEFIGEAPKIKKITARVYLEGSNDSAAGLIYGFRDDIIDALGEELKIGEQAVGANAIYKAMAESKKIVRPIDKLSTSVNVMPIQDAIDLAVFLATCQVQMERFLPGEPYCGGPIDVMVLKTSPKREVVWLPGKALQHPVAGNRA